MPGGRTHSVHRISVKAHQFTTFGCRQHSFRGSFSFILSLHGVLIPPGLRDPASFVEELPDYDHIIASDALGHSHPVDLDVGCEVLPPLHRGPVDSTIMGDGGGTITAFTTFFSIVSFVANSLYLTSFFLTALFMLLVDVTFTATTTFLQSPPASRRSHARSGFSLAPATRPFASTPRTFSILSRR